MKAPVITIHPPSHEGNVKRALRQSGSRVQTSTNNARNENGSKTVLVRNLSTSKSFHLFSQIYICLLRFSQAHLEAYISRPEILGTSRRLFCTAVRTMVFYLSVLTNFTNAEFHNFFRQRAVDIRALLSGDEEQLQPIVDLPGLLRPSLPRPLAHHLRGAKVVALVHRVHASLRYAHRVSLDSEQSVGMVALYCISIGALVTY